MAPRAWVDAVRGRECSAARARGGIATTTNIIGLQARWNTQRQVVAIPGSSNPDHIREDLDIFGFALSEEEMERIAALERNEKHDWY